MNAALYASAFYPSLGGVEEVVRQLAHEQQKAGARPLILTNRWPKDLPAREEFEGLPVRRHIFRVPDASFRQRLGAWLYSKGTLRDLCRATREHAAEVVHVHCVSSNAYYARLVKRRLGLPLVVTLHGELSMDATGLYQKSRFAQSVLRSVLDDADAITACSGQSLEEAERFYGKPFGERGRVIHSGVRVTEIAEAAPHRRERPYVLAIGRHVPQKGFDCLLRAFSQLVRDGERAHDLLLAGDGEERASLEALAGELGLGRRVEFLGRVDRKRAAGLFRGCALFVLPSRLEPMGIVNLEAMAAGKAVVASRTGGVPELLQDGVTGLLATPGDPESLASAIRALLASPEARGRMGDEGRARAARFDWSAVAVRYADAYSAACAHARTCA